MNINNEIFVVSARKYRPAIFDDVIGQESTCQTISNSIKNNQIPSGYLFTGIRGTGKTSLARIIAKTINCTNLDRTGKFVKLCQTCKNCLSVNQNNHPDIVEIDAASHTGVDDIRSIIDSAEYKPMQGAYKIFIIDEVHMLSKSAFNALLKIVEEPPMHVIFILATTEINKVPLTVSSRCQKFVLKRLTIDQIKSLLNKIILLENIKSEQEALEIIAYKADGSARDSLSLLDQVIAISSTEQDNLIKTNIVKKMIGTANNGDLVALLKNIIEQDTKNAIECLVDIQSTHSNLVVFFESFQNFIGFIIKKKTIEDYKSMDLLDFSKEIELLSNKIKLPYLMVLWQIFAKGIKEMKDSHNILICAEIIVIKAIYASTLPSLEEAIKAINSDSNKNEIEKKNFKILIKKEINNDLSTNKIEKLLINLFKDRKFDLYYYLFNEVQLEIINNSILKISGQYFQNQLHKEIEDYTKNLLGKNYQLIREEIAEKALSYKENIKINFKNSKAWQEISSRFKNASIDDILIDAK